MLSPLDPICTLLIPTESLETPRHAPSIHQLAVRGPRSVLPCEATAQGANVVSHLGWMAGCWQQTGANGRFVDEQWMTPRGNTMLGVGRTVRGDSLIEYEQLRIFERDGKAVYHAMPSGQTAGGIHGGERE